MRKKKEQLSSENYLLRKPIRAKGLVWNKDENGIVTCEIENTGFMNRIAQKLFKKPKISYVHLDKTGSFVWPLLDGEKDIAAIGVLVEEEFKDEAQPLYERLAKYFEILDSYHFIEWANKE